MARQTLESWISEALADDEKGNACSAFALVHVNANGGEKPLHSVRLGGAREWTAKDLAFMFDAKAKNYAQDMPGTQMMQLQAFYGKGEAESFHPFSVAGHTDNLNLGTEAPNETGERAQRMRHTEAFSQGLFRERAHVLDASFRVIDSQQSLIRELNNNAVVMQRNHFEYVNVAAEAILRRAADDRTARRELLQFERETGERTQLMKLLPAFANEVLGRPIFPQGTADAGIVEAVIDQVASGDIPPEQVSAFLSMLKPEVAAMLAARVQKAVAERAERERSAANREPEALTDARDVEEVEAAKGPAHVAAE